MSEDIRFYINDLRTRENLGRVYPNQYSFSDPLVDTGEASFTLSMPTVFSANSLVKRMVPNTVELEITIGDPLTTGTVMWAGWINYRYPNSINGTLEFTAIHWKQWPYRRRITPRTWGESNLLEADEYQLAYTLIDWACAPSTAPDFLHDAVLAGNIRQLTVNPWWSVGYALDILAKRDGGFEWGVDFQHDPSTARLQTKFKLWEPGATRKNSRYASFENDDRNMVTFGPPAEDGSRQVTRMFATDDGDNPVYASDTDENLLDNNLLLLEDVATYSGNTDVSSLFQYARAERVARNNPYTTIAVATPIDKPDVTKYVPGDRAHVKVSDVWNNIDLYGVRITNRTIHKTPETRITATISLDLEDVQGEVL